MAPLMQNRLMTDEKALMARIHTLPEELRAEVEKFIDSLAKRMVENGQVTKHRRSKAGSHPGIFKMSPDFDDPIEGFEEYM